MISETNATFCYFQALAQDKIAGQVDMNNPLREVLISVCYRHDKEEQEKNDHGSDITTLGGNTLKQLTVNQLTKIFPTAGGTFTAVDHISFSVNVGEIVSLIGPNGAGKTTTVQMIYGMLLPTSGDIRLDDTLLTEKQRRKISIGLVLGGDSGFYGNATVYDNLSFFAHLKEIKWSQIESEVMRVLHLVGLEDKKKSKTYTLSKGMYQRLHIARALLGKPDILLLDEPTTGLDVELAHEIRDLIKQLAKNEQVAVLLTSHMMSEVEYLSDRLLLINHGKIFIEGSVQDVVAASGVNYVERPATLEESYLGLIKQQMGGEG
ncbi:MAG: ABC transporter ATP-binding protein [Aerococcus sp.]|nr:ABC transporter ATP-binding protein [Aerococcus sp.]